MKIGILTTRTTHHEYFIYKICKNFDNLTIIYELEKKKKKEKLNLFEKKRDKYEKKIISKYKIKFNKNLLEVKNINDNKLADYLKLNCDFLVVFGTTKIKGKLLKYFKNKIFNLHGGDPLKYRGLDSHYWSIYHNDFKSLISTIHFLDKDIDTGNIIYKKKINFSPKNKIYHLRLLNTETLVYISLKLLRKLKKKQKIFSKKQITLGRYYSKMPNIIKNSLEKKFNKFVKLL